MFDLIKPETLELLLNIVVIALGALAIIFVLRGIFKVTWKIIKFLLIVLALVVIVGYFQGWLKISIW